MKDCHRCHRHERAQQVTNLEVIANNIANINTTGYKRACAEFSDLFYQVGCAPGVEPR